MDPDDRNVDLAVRVLSDGVVVAEDVASGFRSDLLEAGVCPGGNCAFRILLWGRIERGVEHSITVQARDLQTGQWTTLESTPRMLKCFNFNLAEFDPIKGEVKPVSDLPDFGQFNPRWSPDGKEIAHVLVGWKKFPTDFICNTRVADLTTGETETLQGAEGGGTAVFSPYGQRIAFDRSCAGDLSVYVVPAGGGTPRLVRTNAVEPDWSPNGGRIVFHQPSDG